MGEGSVVRTAMVRFTLLSGACLIVIVLVSFVLADTLARSIATQEAQDRTHRFADAVASKVMDADTRRESQGSELEAALRSRLTDDSIVHAAVYASDGTIIWSADPSQIGEVEELGEDVQQLFVTHGSVADYETTEHARADGDELTEDVLEVYAGAFDADGEPFVLEWYWPTANLDENQANIVRHLLPLTAGSLLLFGLLVLPLTLATARRVEKERGRRTEFALKLSRADRRRLSEALHDGVVQDLSGIGYVLPIIAKDLPPGSAGHEMLGEVRAAMQRNTSAIRELIADIRPVDLAGDGFREALEGLVARTEAQGVIPTELVVEGNVEELSEAARALILRIAREGLRNVVRHSSAGTASVTVSVQDLQAGVVVADDGVGPGSPAPRPLGEPTEDKHFGLDLVREALQDLGGTVVLRRRPGGPGAELVADFRLDRP